MPYATVTLTDEFDLLRQKRLHLNLPQWSSTRARARKHVTRARARKFWYLLLNQLYCHGKRGRWLQFAGWLKGVNIGTLLQAASRVINLQFFT